MQDYLQLDFDGNRLTCYRWPEVITESGKFVFNDDNYRNVLCSLIAKVVDRVDYLSEVALKISFGENELIVVDLRDPDPEAIYFTRSNGEWESF